MLGIPRSGPGRRRAGRLAAVCLVLVWLGHHETRGRTLQPWLEVARAEQGVREIPGPASHPRIAAYHRTTQLMAQEDEVPWCSSFVNWCLRQVSLVGTDSALARSWLHWGDELCEPRYGSVVVLQGERPFEGHVGFYLGRWDDEVVVLGGNQGDAVSVRAYPAGRVLGYRWPARSAAPAPPLRSVPRALRGR